MTDKPSLIFLDIETSPIYGLSWETYDTNILKVIEPSKIISIAWKELGEEETHCLTLPDFEGYEGGIVNDTKLVKAAWKILDDSDVVIGHNLDAFDIKRLNARFVYHHLNAPSPYKTVDTMKLAKKGFKFDSNSLNNLGEYLGLGKKVENGGFGLWLRCMDGNPKAWELMKQYNIQDVVLLEKVYLALRPFQTNHPNLNAVKDSPSDVPACPTCMSENVQKRGFSVTRTGRKQRYQCGTCGSWSSGPFTKIKGNVLSNDDE